MLFQFSEMYEEALQGLWSVTHLLNTHNKHTHLHSVTANIRANIYSSKLTRFTSVKLLGIHLPDTHHKLCDTHMHLLPHSCTNAEPLGKHA